MGVHSEVRESSPENGGLWTDLQEYTGATQAKKGLLAVRAAGARGREEPGIRGQRGQAWECFLLCPMPGSQAWFLGGLAGSCFSWAPTPVLSFREPPGPPQLCASCLGAPEHPLAHQREGISTSSSALSAELHFILLHQEWDLFSIVDINSTQDHRST